MNVLMFPFGSHGDVHPFLGLGLALQARGHAVTVVSNGHFRALVERCGLPFIEQGTEEEYLRATENPDLWKPRKAFAHIFESGISRVMRPQYDLIAERAAAGQLVVVHNCLGFGARVARENLGVPLVTVHLQPSVLWSKHEPPTIAGIPSWPRWLTRLLLWAGERFILDPIVQPKTNAFRAELGLPPMRRTMSWWHSPDLILGLFPDWYAAPQPDWPKQTVLTHFPLWDEGSVTPMSPEVEAYLNAGPPPIVFTPGSGNQLAAEFFTAAAEACRLLGRRGLLLSRFRDQIPATLPEGVRHFDYVPFGQLLHRAAALVHHGGIGTTAQGLRAGVPQLIMPLAHDQPDNAARIQKLGVGDWLAPGRFHGPAVAAKLRGLLDVPAVAQACQRVAERFAAADPFAQACERIEALGASRAANAETSAVVR